MMTAMTLLAACGDTDPASTPSTRPTPSSTLVSSPTTTDHPSTAVAPSTAPARAAPSTTAADAVSVLVLTRTAGFRHSSIEPATAALTARLAAMGIEVVVDPDATMVTDSGLADFDAIVMLSTTGDWLDEAQQAAIERWAAAGGGIAGIHAATDAEPDWPFLEEALGARFAGHPAVQPATVVIEDAAHPATAVLPVPWNVTDEWYDFATNPRDRVHVLATVDEATYTGGTMGPDHPIEWSREPSAIAGRTWYTAMGHPDELWADATFVSHVAAGVAWSAGVDVRGVAAFTSGATVDEPADRLDAFEVGDDTG